MTEGTEEGQICGRVDIIQAWTGGAVPEPSHDEISDPCSGVIEMTVAEDCRCHISPPCKACLDVHPHCPVCGWEDATHV